MKRILFEGTELSGKTTLANSLIKALELESVVTQYNTGPTDKNSRAIKYVLDLSQKTENGFIKEIGYTLSLLLDKNSSVLYNSLPGYIIQDRGFPSVMAYSRVFSNFGINKNFGKILSKAYSHYDYNIFLRTDMADRINRIKLRDNPTFLDKLVLTRPDMVFRLENEIEKIMCMEKNYLEIDTTKIGVDEATVKILGHLRQK
ncbi:MAG: hypothetical protein ACP5OA_05055 [Candidatus Woesearchaeota archaeon]